MQQFIDTHVAKVKPMGTEVALTSWQAETTGEGEVYERLSGLRLELATVYTDRREYGYLKDAKESGQIKDPLLLRQMGRLYRSYLANQIDPDLLKKLVDAQTAIGQKFNVHRGTIDGKEVTLNEIKGILRSETDSKKRKKAWLAAKQVGPVVAEDIIAIVRLRNQAARQIGFENYHTFSLALSEQDVKDVEKILDELDRLTAAPFRKVKAELDGVLAGMYGISPDELMPWHYHDPFFQEVPLVYGLDLDAYYKDKDIRAIAEKFYTSIGLPVGDILTRSDLYERKGKCPHAFCTNIDYEGDVRILCNINDNAEWMEVTLHELGHAVYSKNFDPDTPWLLRDAAHIFTTEGVAMFFGRLNNNEYWMQEMLGLSDAERDRIGEVSARYARLKQLIFARWDMVVFNFERRLYADPEQDLNKLWWDLIERYQFIKRPPRRNQPDWAAKIHIASAPCYYHNYMLGELFASQMHNYIVKNVLRPAPDNGVSYVGRRELGDYLRKNVFEAGKVYHWNEMVRRATGETLNPKYFVDQFVN